MENINTTPLTPESVLALIRELSLDFDKRMKESNEKFAREMEESRAENARRIAEDERRKKEWDEKFENSRVEADKRIAELNRGIESTKKTIDDLAIRTKETNEIVNGIAKSNGMCAEEFFYNAIINDDRNIFGEHFDQFYNYMRHHDKSVGLRGEQDIILFNCNAAALIEVKYRARKTDIQKIIDRLPAFRQLYKEHKDNRIYLAIAAMSFDKDVEKECNEKGIAIVKELGDTVVINDDHLRYF